LIRSIKDCTVKLGYDEQLWVFDCILKGQIWEGPKEGPEGQRNKNVKIYELSTD
jgi:hypothetical protein